MDDATQAILRLADRIFAERHGAVRDDRPSQDPMLVAVVDAIALSLVPRVTTVGEVCSRFYDREGQLIVRATPDGGNRVTLDDID